ncbi:MAG: hypothetical protein IT326_04295 [Anaerolineae bacterium]|nr:hypothetical protein [Anaerolineae bacterium]
MNHVRLSSLLLLLALIACHPASLSLPNFPHAASVTPALSAAADTLTPTVLPPSVTPLPPTDTPAPLPTLTPTATPEGCLSPPDDYTRVLIGEHELNARTLAMLEHAQILYGGNHDLVRALTQGSYNIGVSASFGTHDAGGAIDLSLRDLANWHNVLTGEAPAIIDALRRAGFAAWIREQDELYSGSPVHIHAIAIGDVELSPAAQEQLTGPAGYFRGFNGLPVDPPTPDTYGGPILCPWMAMEGYSLLY